MKFATSLKFSGELVAAVDCDYDSFKHFMLICPHCKQSVYLIGEHGRAATVRKLKSGSTVPVKESSVSAHFVHHLLDIESCEAKDLSISNQSILHRKTVARNQRLAIFRDRFWHIFCTTPSIAYLSQMAPNQKLFDNYFERVMKMEMFGSSVMKTEMFRFAIDRSRPIADTPYADFDREYFTISLATGMNIARENYSINLLNPSFTHVFAEAIDTILKYVLPEHLYRQVYLPFILEPLCFLYAPPNKKVLKKCLGSLVLSVYTKSLHQAIKHIANTSFISKKMTADEARNSLYALTYDVANSLLAGKQTFTLSNSVTIEVSSLFMIFLTSLSSVDWGCEFEK